MRSNNNKYYIIQLLEANGSYALWTRSAAALRSREAFADRCPSLQLGSRGRGRTEFPAAPAQPRRRHQGKRPRLVLSVSPAPLSHSRALSQAFEAKFKDKTKNQWCPTLRTALSRMSLLTAAPGAQVAARQLCQARR